MGLVHMICAEDARLNACHRLYDLGSAFHINDVNISLSARDYLTVWDIHSYAKPLSAVGMTKNARLKVKCL